MRCPHYMPDRQVSVWSNPQRAALNGWCCEALSVEPAGADGGTEESRQRGAALFGKTCAPCHDAAKKTPDKTPGPPLVGTGSMFVENWKDHTIGEIFTTILTTMPNDGSVVLTENDTADLVAHLLQSNGYPDGPEALKFDAAAKTIKIVAVK